MEVQLLHAITMSSDLKKHKNDLDSLLSTTVEITNSTIDDEYIYRASIIINSLEKLLEIQSLLDDNLVVYGVNQNVLMTVKTMRELGLN